MALLEAFGAPLPGLVPSKEAKALLASGALRHEKLCATLKDERIAPQLRAAKEQLSTCVDEPILNAVEASLSASRLGVANVLDEMVAACEDGLAQAACGAKEDAHETLDRAVGAARQAQRRLHATLTAALQPCEAAITDMASLAAQAPQAAIEAASRALVAGCAQAARELATGLDAARTQIGREIARAAKGRGLGDERAEAAAWGGVWGRVDAECNASLQQTAQASLPLTSAPPSPGPRSSPDAQPALALALTLIRTLALALSAGEPAAAAVAAARAGLRRAAARAAGGRPATAAAQAMAGGRRPAPVRREPRP